MAGAVIPLRMRSDLVVSPRVHDGQQFWAVKDPVSLRYYLLRPEEYFVLQALDGRTTVTEVLERFAARFAPRGLSQRNCYHFLDKLVRDSLVESTVPRAGDRLYHRCVRRRAEARRAWMQTLLFARLPGFNPDPWLSYIEPRVRLVFSAKVQVAATVLVVYAMMTVISQWQRLTGECNEFYRHFAERNLTLHIFAIAVVKLLHELGHGLTCKHFGAEVPSFGIRLLGGIPAFYCDVSDSWMVASRWQRMAITLAGVWVELIVAAAAGLVWTYTLPGTVNAVARTVMILASVNSLLINGNPLLRFDGYFVLVDFVNTPNLAGRARRAVQSLMLRWTTGLDDGGSRQERPEVRQWLFVYGTLSLAYQALVLLGLLWFVRGVLAVLHLESLLIVFALFVCSMLLAGPVMTLLRVLRVPGVWQQASRSRMMATAIAFGLLVVAACGIPIPNYVKTPALVRAEDAATIYVTRPGRLVSTVDANRRVATGEVLAQLQDWELEEEVLEANAAYEQQRVHVNAMRSLRSYDPSVRGEYESEKEKLETMRRRCEYLAEELQRLTLRAPRDGWVLPPAVRAEEGEHERLAHWTGTPLDERNRNSLLEERTELCTIGDPAKLEAVLLVNESDVSLISVGQPVKLRVDGVGGSLVRGTIREVSQVGSVVDLRQFGGKGGRERLLEPSELTRPTQVVYQVQVRLDGEMHPLLIGSRGTALVRSNATTVASQCYRFLREHVRSSL